MLLSSSLTRLSIILAFVVLQQGSNDICAANETADLKNLDYGGAVDGDGDERELQGAPVSNPASSFWMDFLGAIEMDDHDHDDGDDHDHVPLIEEAEEEEEEEDSIPNSTLIPTKFPTKSPVPPPTFCLLYTSPSPRDSR